MELHKLMTILNKFGGKIAHCNTDNAVAFFKDREVIVNGKTVIETAQEQIDKMWEYASKICWDDEKKSQKI